MEAIQMTKYIKADEFYYLHVKGAGYLYIEGDSFGDWQVVAPHGADIIDYTGFSGTWFSRHTSMALLVLMSWTIIKRFLKQ